MAQAGGATEEGGRLMSLAVVHSRALDGLEAPEVQVEVQLANGLPSFMLVGLAETEVKESRERVRAALQQSGLPYPHNKRITVNLAPADLPKESGRFDLPIALGVLAAAGVLCPQRLAACEFAGELSLAGELRPVRGALALALAARRSGRGRSLVLPQDSAELAAQVGEQPVYGARHLAEVVAALLPGEAAQPLALALAAEGASVGVLDADIYGPSQPMMMGIEGRPESVDGQTMEPLENYGVQVISIGFLVDPDQAMIWRGPMATQALEQLLRQTRWRELDYLLIDMPPGTGDIALTLSQRVPLTGAVIVTTPQDIALLDVKRGVEMFKKVGVPILGIVENMAVYCCPNCGHTEHIFGANGGQRMAEKYGVDLLGSLPLTLTIREQADAGRPTVVADPDSAIAATYRQIARSAAVKVAQKAKDFSAKFPTISVSKTT